MDKMTNSTNTATNPRWYNDTHTSGWERVKAALQRDWEQTKNDMSSSAGRDLNQDVGDTLKQATGKDAVPAPSQKTKPDTDWQINEPALRYGYSARSQYKDHNDWDDRLEGKLRTEWNDLKSGRTYEEAKTAIRRGWDKGGPDTH